MRVLLKLTLDCDVDAAWRALRSPAVFRSVSAPFTTFSSLESGGFPESWPAGDHPVAGKAFGVLPIGEQVIRISFPELRDGVRAVLDTGFGLSGPLALVRGWHHTMAVASTIDGRTLYRDELRFDGGLVGILSWPLYWAFWQWRAIRIATLARRWK